MAIHSDLVTIAEAELSLPSPSGWRPPQFGIRGQPQSQLFDGRFEAGYLVGGKFTSCDMKLG